MADETGVLMWHMSMGSNKQMDVSCVQVKKKGVEDGPLRNAEENRMRSGNQPRIGNLLCSAVQE